LLLKTVYRLVSQFAYDFVKLVPVCSKQEIEEENEEVLETQFVIIS